MKPFRPELCRIRKAYADLVLLGWFCYYRGGSWFLVTEQKLVLLVHHLTAVIHCPALVLLAQPWAVLRGGFCLSPRQISSLIRRSVWREDVGNVLTWETSLLTGSASQAGAGRRVCASGARPGWKVVLT